MFKNKIYFTADEEEAVKLLAGDGLLFNPSDKDHIRLRPALSNLFFRGLMDRGNRAINHYVLNALGEKAVEYNDFFEIFNKPIK